MSAVVELKGLGVHLGKRQILHDLTGSLSGHAIGLLGPNGSGKTTLLHTLLGFYPASSGTATVGGKDIRMESKAIRSMVGYMPENESFIPGINAVRFVRLMAELSGLPPSAALERAHEALFYVGLGEARYRKMETFSLGMKQRVKLAQALVHAPQLIVLDEPTNGLDPPARQRMIRLIQEIRDSGKVRLIVSSHLLRDVEESCDAALVLKQGRVAAYVDLEQERQANKRFLEMEAYGDTEAFTAAVAGLGCELAAQGNGKIKMVLNNGVQIHDLYRLAAERDVRIRRLDYKRDSLQDIFLKAMEERPNGSV